MPDTTSPAKKYYDQANQAIDEQAILDKYNAATVAQFNVQREQNRQAENKFYNQMYNTQRTAMDTIRQSNAAAVSSGASRGVQAANELSALLGLQSESVASATELAQNNRQVAQEETAAVLENVLKAYQQAQQERAQMVQHGIEAASVDVQQNANNLAAQEFALAQQQALQSAATEGTAAYLTALSGQGYDFKTYSEQGVTSLDLALNVLANTDGALETDENNPNRIGKIGLLRNNVQAICNTYGLDYDAFKAELDNLARTNIGAPAKRMDTWNTEVNKLMNKIREQYAAKATK